MAAAYSTGVSSSPTNLLQAIVAFLSAQGWVTNLSASDGLGWRAHCSLATQYFNARAAMDERLYPATGGGFYDAGTNGYGIGFYMGDGYSGAAAWDAQSGRPTRDPSGDLSACGMNLPQGSTAAYHFFDDGNGFIDIVVERSAGIFTHMGFGPSTYDVGLDGAYPYFYASSSAYMNTIQIGELGVATRHGVQLSAYPPFSHTDEDVALGSGTSLTHCTAFVKVSAAVYANRWVGDCNPENEDYGWTGRRLRCALNKELDSKGAMDEGQYPNYQWLFDDTDPLGPGERTLQSSFTGALLNPLHAFVETDPGDRWSPVGFPPNVFWCEAVGNGFAAGDIYPIGGVNYMLFPGFAVKKAA